MAITQEEIALQQGNEPIDLNRRRQNMNLLPYLSDAGFNMQDGYFLMLRQLESTDYSEQTSCSLTPLVLALKDLLVNQDNSSLTPQEKAWVEYQRRNIVIHIERLADGSARDFLLENNDPSIRYAYLQTYADGFNGATDIYSYHSRYEGDIVGSFYALHRVDPTKRGFPSDSLGSVERYDFNRR